MCLTSLELIVNIWQGNYIKPPPGGRVDQLLCYFNLTFMRESLFVFVLMYLSFVVMGLSVSVLSSCHIQLSSTDKPMSPQ